MIHQKVGNQLEISYVKTRNISSFFSDKQKINEVEKLTDEEKQKLYQAIGYTGKESFAEYPNEVI